MYQDRGAPPLGESIELSPQKFNSRRCILSHFGPILDVTLTQEQEQGGPGPPSNYPGNSCYFCPDTAPETISEGLKSKIFLGGHAPRPPQQRYMETYATRNLLSKFLDPPQIHAIQTAPQTALLSESLFKIHTIQKNFYLHPYNLAPPIFFIFLLH